MGELEILERAHRMLAQSGPTVRLAGEAEHFDRALHRLAQTNAGAGHDGYQRAADASRAVMRRAADTDGELAAVLEGARREHDEARGASARLLQQARDDAARPPLSPMAQREALRRSANRLRAQHVVISTARRRGRRRAALLRLLRYRAEQRRVGRRGLPPPSGRAAAAVRAALSKLGRPYVWGATGPNQFDCSGLVQWAYHQAGIPLHRTTYDQIHDGIAVPRSQIQPGDLVFPHTGHVQMAIGNGMVVEAPHAGANVRISRLGDVIAIRRPV